MQIKTTRNTVVATPRGLIAVIENNYQEDGFILITNELTKFAH